MKKPEERVYFIVNSETGERIVVWQGTNKRIGCTLAYTEAAKRNQLGGAYFRWDCEPVMKVSATETTPNMES